MNILLWIVQVLLALLFLFAGGLKLILPASQLQAPQGQLQFPVLFLRFIGVCELVGGLGMLLPGILRIRTTLTPLAAAGLVIIMIGAVVVSLMGGGVGVAIVPFVTLVLCAFVAYGRTKLAPLPSR